MQNGNYRITIIITNEKIKVMLSRKRCRGTLQDYNKGEISECQSKLWTNRSQLVSEWNVVDIQLNAVALRVQMNSYETCCTVCATLGWNCHAVHIGRCHAR